MNFDEMKSRVLEDPKGPYALSCTSHAPYDGCFHEPNYWLVKNQKVCPLYISGESWSWFNFWNVNKPWMSGTHFLTFLEKMSSSHAQGKYDDWEYIDLENWEFENYNVLNTITVILMQHQVPLPKWACTQCSEPCRGRAKFLSYRGNGGIGIFLEDPACSTCFSKIRWCEVCEKQIVLEGEELDCPNGDEKEIHTLHPVEDEGENFGLTGEKFLEPNGDAEGLLGVAIVFMTKGAENEV